MTSTIQYVTEMVEVATGKVTERKVVTIKGNKPASELMMSVPCTKAYRGGQYLCRVVKAWAC